MNPANKSSRREFSRIPFQSDIQLHLGQTWQTVHLLDIALKGALVETLEPFAVNLGEACSLVLPLSGSDEKIVMEGSIVHLEDGRIGIECCHIDVDSLTNLRRLVELNLGDASLAERELSKLFTRN